MTIRHAFSAAAVLALLVLPRPAQAMRSDTVIAAQEVQVSAFPNHYAKWERQAGSIIKALYGAGPYAKQARQAR